MSTDPKPQPPAGGDFTPYPAAPLPPDVPAPQEPVGYQPLSGWAIAGFAVSLCFAAIVTVSVVVALFIGAPVFLHPAIVALPVVGIVLSWIGLTQINNSEGTRAGARLARTGIWLSLVPGLCYFSYSYFTGLALQNQANAFLMEKLDEDHGFFPRLREGATNPVQHNAAFLLTLPPSQRGGLRPENEAELRKRHDKPTKEGPGPLANFREGSVARIFFGDLAKDAEITPLAVRDWKYESRRYSVERIYRIQTREVIADFFVAVESMEGENPGEGRKWYVKVADFSNRGIREYTPVGLGVATLRRQGVARVYQWFESLNQGKAWPAFKEHDQTAWHLLRLAEGDRVRVREAITQAFTGTRLHRFQRPQVYTRQDEVGKWEQTAEGRVRLHHSLRFGLDLKLTPDNAGPTVAQSNVEATVVVESKQDRINLAQVQEAPPLDWEVVRITINQVTPVDRLGPP